MMKLPILLALVAFSAAQVPKPCLAPVLFEAITFTFKPANYEFRRSHLSVDGIHHSIYFTEEHIPMLPQTTSEYILLYDQDIYYSFNRFYKNCTRGPWTMNWGGFGVPDDATFYAEDYMGSGMPHNGVLVNMWGGNDTSGTAYDGAWTSDACMPVFTKYTNPQSGVVYESYFNVTFGFVDPNVFVPPSYCPTQ